ncbi:tripartite tricarboxylate transporter substrate binding protein [Ramlibacter sp. 2FC]|uniref:Bug family tripartite tricarboxylate transporter substrate binding protein n=1 Tax=Ramlibacter sp. 2FC TaxID=2502188 RepID=UPI0010F50568|nr:tripartite tricarboxylate transporter substrate binding protein [Ramlibacter sp. 2FC]
MTPSPSLTRRSTLLAALALAAGGAAAQADYPHKPVRIVVQYQAGGMSDALARVIAEPLAQRLGQPVLVENRSGAGGIIGTDYVAKSAPDGHTLLLTVPGPVTANLALYSKLPYDPRTELRMVSDIALPRLVLAVHPSVPATDFKGLLAAIKAAPGKYSMGSWGPGTQPHQIQVFMDRQHDLKTTHVPYKGEAPMVVDLVGGVISMTVGSTASLQQHIASGKLRALAVAGPRRAKALPEVPTFAEQGFADTVYAITGPISVMAPAKTPGAVVERLGREIAAIVRQPEVARRIEGLGAEPLGNTPAEAAAAYQALLPVALKLTQDTGVRLD